MITIEDFKKIDYKVLDKKYGNIIVNKNPLDCITTF